MLINATFTVNTKNTILEIVELDFLLFNLTFLLLIDVEFETLPVALECSFTYTLMKLKGS